MVTARDINNIIIRLTSNMIKIGLCEDQNYPSMKNYSGGIEEITTTNSDNSIFLKNISYDDMYKKLCEQRVFNMKMIDGALIHMQYRFKNKIIENHRLTYFPAPNLELFQNEPETYMRDEIYSDILDKKVVTVPLRFDFDDSEDEKGKKISKPILHPISHLTIGQYRNCRIPVSSALMPSQFLKFIIMNFYNTAYNSYTDEFPEIKDCFSTTLYSEEKEIINICAPSIR